MFHFTEKGRLPILSKEEYAEIRKRFPEVLKDYPDVTFYGTWVDEKGMGICLWEAPSVETVREIVKKALGQPPADPVIQVRKVL